MTLESLIDRELMKELKNYKKCLRLMRIIERDEEVYGLLEQANKVMVVRMGFNDHGRVHSKIVALNALKIYSILEKKKIFGNIILEEIGNAEDVRMALLLGAYVHDIGNSVSRDDHEILGVILARSIITRMLRRADPDADIAKIARIRAIIIEEILCHLGKYRSTCLESKIVATADGTDMTKGRARIPYKLAKPDIHKFSALAIEKVSICEGKKKPVRIVVEMNDTTGIFQVEEQLLQKIRDVGFRDYVEIVAKVKGRKEIEY
ncbi:MAG: HD domain-containing protein [Candidatus Aenigmarchaeota archaeon]|nr:HD domain-containing protein [Candidatus Aenigmarchaeota archaeon]